MNWLPPQVRPRPRSVPGNCHEWEAMISGPASNAACHRIAISTVTRLASVRAVNEIDLVTSIRRAASVCGVSLFIVRGWMSRGLVSEPPWTLQQLCQAGAIAEPAGQPQAAHGSTARWNAGCGCRTTSSQAEADRRAEAEAQPTRTHSPKSEPKSEPSPPSVRRGVHPGALFFSGALGATATGTSIVCKGPGQPRWRAR
jgi:hypothetical protein